MSKYALNIIAFEIFESKYLKAVRRKGQAARGRMHRQQLPHEYLLNKL